MTYMQSNTVFRPGIPPRSWFAVVSIALVLSGCASSPSAPPSVPSPAPTPTPQIAVRQTAAPPPTPRAVHRAELPANTALSVIGTESVTPPPVVLLSAPTDIWDRIRRGLTMPDLDNELVRDREQWYASRPDYIGRMTERSSRYLFHIVEEIERRNLPMELALLPFIESAFNPQAVSSARAAGMWQFMPATGESFDLKQNMFRDDRRDVLASTRAALDYLEQLHTRFGDWHLALAAYNWGQGNVNRAITRNQRAGLPTGYLDLNMPLETRMYVPKLQAVENLVARPESLGAVLPSIGNHPFFDTLTLERDMDVALIAELAGISEQDFRSLNPSIRQPLVMAAGTPRILLPWDNAKTFEEGLKTYRGPLASWTAWVAPDTLAVSEVARRVGMGEAELRRINNIPPGMKVRQGSSLLVLRSAQRNSDVSEYVADNAQLSLAPEVILKRTVVRAKKGDNLARLAARYGVSAVSAAGWNRMAVHQRLNTGQRITLMLPRSVKLARSGPTTAKKSVSADRKKNSKAASKAGKNSTKQAKKSNSSRPSKARENPSGNKVKLASRDKGSRKNEKN